MGDARRAWLNAEHFVMQDLFEITAIHNLTLQTKQRQCDTWK